MSDLITCEQVGYRQQGAEILADVDWRIERGEHWAVLGPNGCGKTTLLRIACGYLWPTSGRVLRLGKELIDLGELRRSIGWISSDLAGRIPADGHRPRNRRHRPARSDRAQAIPVLRTDRRPTSPTRPPSSRASVASRWPRNRSACSRKASVSKCSSPARGWPGRCCWCSTSRAPAWTPACASDSWPGSTNASTAPDSPTVDSRHAPRRRDRARHREDADPPRRPRPPRRPDARRRHPRNDRRGLRHAARADRDERRPALADLGLNRDSRITSVRPCRLPHRATHTSDPDACDRVQVSCPRGSSSPRTPCPKNVLFYREVLAAPGKRRLQPVASGRRLP